MTSSTSQASLNIYTSKTAAQSAKSADQTMIFFKRNKTSNNPEAFQRAILLPLSVFQSGNRIVDIAREIAAVDVLKKFCESTSYDSACSADLFSPEALDSKFVEMHEDSGSSDWLSKEELQQLWNSSETRKEFVSRDLYKSNSAYQQAVNMFGEKILSLAGKATQMSPEWQDRILSKLNEKDLEFPLGEFITFRISKMQEKMKNDDILNLL